MKEEFNYGGYIIGITSDIRPELGYRIMITCNTYTLCFKSNNDYGITTQDLKPKEYVYKLAIYAITDYLGKCVLGFLDYELFCTQTKDTDTYRAYKTSKKLAKKLSKFYLKVRSKKRSECTDTEIEEKVRDIYRVFREERNRLTNPDAQ